MKQSMFSEFPLEEYKDRVGKARELMSRDSIDALLLTEEENVIYYTGYLSAMWRTKVLPFYVILPLDGEPVLVTYSYEKGNASKTSCVEDIRLWGGAEHLNLPKEPISLVVEALHDLGLEKGNIGMELGTNQILRMSYDTFEFLKSKLPEVEIAHSDKIIWEQRMIKSHREIEKLRRAAEITCKAHKAALESLRPGMTERDLAETCFKTILDEGGEPIGISMRAIPERYDMTSYLIRSIDRRVDKGNLVAIDLVSAFQGYRADIARTGILGEPSEKQRKIFEAVVRAVDAAIQNVQPGAKASDIYSTAMNIFEEAGYKRNYELNGCGHGIGLITHEPPSIAKTDETPLDQGMVITIEPWLLDPPDYQDGVFALEQQIVITKSGCELLSAAADPDLWII